MTRWVTHFCAPVFMFTAGLGAYFFLARSWRKRSKTSDKAQLSRFLVTRGLWLIVLELTVMRLPTTSNLDQSVPFFLLVLWGLGLCMIALAALVWLPIPLLSVLSVATIVLHHLADGSAHVERLVLDLLHQVGVIPVRRPRLHRAVSAGAVGRGDGAGLLLRSGCCGCRPINEDAFASAPWYRHAIAFLLVRGLNGYGDPSRWAWQPTATYTVLSFLNTTKYPPSLAFLLMTLGPALIVLAAFDRMTFSRTNPLIVFGRVPLFYFVLHFIAAHVAIVLMSIAKYGTAALGFMFQPVPSMGGPANAFPPGFGYDLWVAYAVWIAIVVALYPVCRWFASVKERRRDWWLSYL